MAKFIKIFCVAGLGMLLPFLFSCEQQHEPAPPPPQVKVVKKSIDLSKRAGTAEKTASSSPVASSVENTEATAANSTPKELKSVQQQEGPEVAASPIVAGEMTETPSQPVTEAQVKTELAAAETSMDNALTTKKYDTKGRIDPFIPLLSEKKEEPVAAESEEEKPKRILTPLEKMELSQIKLVAVVELKGRFMAMVEEASGKGYPVEIGTYMGTNGGQVSTITPAGIVVKEFVKDFKGNRRERIQEIKFHKDEGGE